MGPARGELLAGKSFGPSARSPRWRHRTRRGRRSQRGKALAAVAGWRALRGPWSATRGHGRARRRGPGAWSPASRAPAPPPGPSSARRCRHPSPASRSSRRHRREGRAAPWSPDSPGPRRFSEMASPAARPGGGRWRVGHRRRRGRRAVHPSIDRRTQPSAAAADPPCFRRAAPAGTRPRGRCRRRAAVDAVPASGAVGRVHEGTW